MQEQTHNTVEVLHKYFFSWNHCESAWHNLEVYGYVPLEAQEKKGLVLTGRNFIGSERQLLNSLGQLL